MISTQFTPRLAKTEDKRATKSPVQKKPLKSRLMQVNFDSPSSYHLPFIKTNEQSPHPGFVGVKRGQLPSGLLKLHKRNQNFKNYINIDAMRQMKEAYRKALKDVS